MNEDKVHIIHTGNHEDITKPLAEGKEIIILGPGGGSGVDLTRPATGNYSEPRSQRRRLMSIKLFNWTVFLLVLTVSLYIKHRWGVF